MTLASLQGEGESDRKEILFIKQILTCYSYIQQNNTKMKPENIRKHGSFSGKPVRRVKAEPFWTGKK